ncbi:UNVERIFIED_CONTAM: hypothetical protein NCL1_30349 [Trichonephila clavipes]
MPFPPEAAIRAAIQRVMMSNRFRMSVCGREFHVAYMRSQSLFFEAAGRTSRARRQPTKSQTCSLGDISVE